MLSQQCCAKVGRWLGRRGELERGPGERRTEGVGWERGEWGLVGERAEGCGKDGAEGKGRGEMVGWRGKGFRQGVPR